jgi:transcriptional regulator with XRE-family HTH domain
MMRAKARGLNHKDRKRHTGSEIDRHVGARVRMRRIMLDLTQEAIAEEVGVSYQQFQKYETGTNRMSASRLQQISNVLKVSPSFTSSWVSRK